MYALAARRVLNGAGPAEKGAAVDELLDKRRQRRPTYPEFEAAFVELRSSRVYTQQTTLVRYVLTNLHVAAAPSSAAPVDVDLLTVEYLVPQGAKRPASIPVADVARLGNLVLVTEKLNQQLEDKSFSEKRKILAVGVDGIEPEIVSAKAWELTYCNRRSEWRRGPNQEMLGLLNLRFWGPDAPRPSGAAVGRKR